MKPIMITMVLLSVMITFIVFFTWYKKCEREDRIKVGRQRIEIEEANNATLAKAAEAKKKMEKEWGEAVEVANVFIRTGKGYDAALEKFEGISSSYENTQLANFAQKQIAELKEARNKGVSRVLLDLEKRAGALAVQNRHAEAAELFTGYSGIYQEETAERRLELSEKYAKAVKEEKENEASAGMKKAYVESRNVILGRIAVFVSGAKFKDALELVGKPAMEIPSEDAEAFKSLAASLESLIGVDNLIVKNIEGKTGARVGFISKGRMDSGEINKVSGVDIYVKQNLDGRAFVTKTSLQALCVLDKLKFAEGLSIQAKAIYAALLYAETGNSDEIGKNLELSGIIGEYLRPLLIKN